MRTVLGDVPAQSSRLYRAKFLGPDKQPIDPALVSSIQLTLVDVLSGTVIRDAQNVKEEGTLEAGEFTLVFAGADVAVVGSAPRQPRVGTFRIDYNLGTELHEIEYTVVGSAYV